MTGMTGQKALRLGGLVFAITLGASVVARADSGKRERAWAQFDGWLAQDALPGMEGGDDAKAKPAAKASTDFKITRQDGTTVTGRVHDKGDSLVVDTAQGPVEIPKADISAIRSAP